MGRPWNPAPESQQIVPLFLPCCKPGPAGSQHCRGPRNNQKVTSTSRRGQREKQQITRAGSKHRASQTRSRSEDPGPAKQTKQQSIRIKASQQNTALRNRRRKAAANLSTKASAQPSTPGRILRVHPENADSGSTRLAFSLDLCPPPLLGTCPSSAGAPGEPCPPGSHQGRGRTWF